MQKLTENTSHVTRTKGVKYFSPKESTTIKKTIVIGAGPVGIRFANELLKRQPDAEVAVFSNEPYQPYNRVQLSSLLAGSIDVDGITTKLPNKTTHPNFSHIISAIREIDHLEKNVIDISGARHDYDQLVIATGSRPHVPNIPGIDQTGVYTFRNLKDAEFLYSRVSSARHIVVVGGGLLGLEAAKALLRFNTTITLVQQGPRLMNRQLDDQAAKKLLQIVEGLNIRVITNSGVRKVLGEGRVTGVVTRDKETIECDTVLLCAGIKPNLEIARSSKIKVGRGILVDDHLKTSAEDVYAIGECCEHRGTTYGLVNPGYEQAAILADFLVTNKTHYIGSLEISRLKVLGVTICSMGDVSDLDKRPFQNEFQYRNKAEGVYRKIVTYKGHIIGAVGFGEWEESRRIQEAYQHQRRIWPWQALLFLLSGRLFSGGQEDDISTWPKTAIVCQCNSISQGALTQEISSGASSLEALQNKTSAGTVCGSCKPLLSQLLGNNDKPERESSAFTVLTACILAAAVVLLLVLTPGLSVSDSVQTIDNFEKIWNDKFWKQVTGFTLLGISALGLLMSLRKRLPFIRRLGEYAWWRLVHITLGLFCACTLILHTGFHLGTNFNQILMFDFIGVIVAGSLAGAFFSFSHKFGASKSRRLRNFWNWGHIFLTWPLPVLLSIHILTVYYF
ncbi:MAG: FAD-dependent oxidoreductase [Agarilytica sp.]